MPQHPESLCGKELDHVRVQGFLIGQCDIWIYIYIMIEIMAGTYPPRICFIGTDGGGVDGAMLRDSWHTGKCLPPKRSTGWKLPKRQ